MKSIAANFFSIIILTIAGIAPVQAQPYKNPSAKITGSVVDENNKPVVLASVTLFKADDLSVMKGSLTNDAGVYNFNNISPGSYVVGATVDGYQKTTGKPFTVVDSTIVTVPQLIIHLVTHSLNEVIISATKPLIERKIDRMVMNVENSVLAAGNSVLEILERAPGVAVDKDDNITIKGKDEVTIMINDKPTYLTPGQLGALLRSTDGATVQSIEIITNPSAKFEAAGSSGIINIKLKKNKQKGSNGSVSLGAAYGKTFKNSETITLNHKEGDLNLFGSFSHIDRKYQQEVDKKRIVADSSGGNTYFKQLSSLPNDTHTNSYSLGVDYDISSANSIGFSVDNYFDNELNDDFNKTYIGAHPGMVNSYQTTASRASKTYNNFGLNLNDRIKVDTAGHEIVIDLNYYRNNNNAEAAYNTAFFLPDGSTMAPPLSLRNQTLSVSTIKTGKVDHSLPLSKTLKLETGFELSDVKINNGQQAQKQVNGNYINDTTFTNRFIYTEKVDAAYINLSQTYKDFSVQFGMRAEYTSSTGDLVNKSNLIRHHYLDIFPSVFLTKTLNDNNELGLSYSRRIDRPGFNDLNPFVFYLDQYSYQKGNPFLRPQYTDNFELNYTWNKSVTLTLNYGHTSDGITQVLATDLISNATFQTNLNLQNQNNYSINLYAPFNIAKWWEGNVNITGFYLKFKSDALLGGMLNNKKAAFQIKTTQNFSIAKGYKAELSSFYNSSTTLGIYSLKPVYATDIGVSHAFADKKASIKVSVRDIFHTRRNNFTTFYQSNNIDVKQNTESRIARLIFTYKFGNNKLRIREHHNSPSE